ncbi:hypothetical protein HGQ17_02670 [Nesterenkonia sp. MY13]|uniref:Uncharacterized protein n=1 Tax=Nesterenkonia sedimenti TaxID=1463632 RepID=A0A7X8YD18_9MICC|nr:hypothetical protein [Nesterenkonia sedimenti]NLS08921.1 hypothetical protein [Nesterenkonia sedimenti]
MRNDSDVADGLYFDIHLFAFQDYSSPEEQWEEAVTDRGDGDVGDEGYFVFSLPSTGFESTGDLGPSEEQLEAQIELAELILERM